MFCGLCGDLQSLFWKSSTSTLCLPINPTISCAERRFVLFITQIKTTMQLSTAMFCTVHIMLSTRLRLPASLTGFAYRLHTMSSHLRNRCTVVPSRPSVQFPLASSSSNIAVMEPCGGYSAC